LKWLGKTDEGSTGRLLQLCAAYFLLYVLTGAAVKYFQGKPELGLPGMSGPEFLVYSLVGGVAFNVVLIFALGWYRMQSNRRVRVLGVEVPSELAYIIPSGVCTAVVVPTTTLMYTLPISVMVAMTIMRGSVIVISRLVDAIQIRQGILKKRVVPEENVAVLFAILAVITNVGFQAEGGFDFVKSSAAVAILGSYITAYAIRIYLMNYFKNTRQEGVKQDNSGFFALEQISASVVMVLACVLVFFAPVLFGTEALVVEQFRGAILAPKSTWLWAILVGGVPFGGVAVFSVFIFMFKGRTATFAGLVNRLTSLVAGTTATLLFALFVTGRFPGLRDWIALGFILIAVAFLRQAEKKRAAKGSVPR
jgi:hypothetical protein